MKDRLCKRCLLREAGENRSFKAVKDYLQTLDDNIKVGESLYNSRLEKCMECDSLISGMCLKCGCYVEIRAALKSNNCADFDNRKW